MSAVINDEEMVINDDEIVIDDDEIVVDDDEHRHQSFSPLKLVIFK